MWVGPCSCNPWPGIPGVLAVLSHGGEHHAESLGDQSSPGSRWVGDPRQQMQRSGWDFAGQARFGGRAQGEQVPTRDPPSLLCCLYNGLLVWPKGTASLDKRAPRHLLLGLGGWGHTEHIKPRP